MKVVTTTVLLCLVSPMTTIAEEGRLADYIAARKAEFGDIPAGRRELLAGLADFIRAERRLGRAANLVFICTHNSRRSQMGQIWAAAAGAHYGAKVETFSGGTERTAFNPRAVAALERAGFDVHETIGVESNPRYRVRYDVDAKAVEAFSKVYSESPNPSRGFCAVMTCSQADEACPNVAGAVERIALPYDDPKVSDGTPEEAATYDERCAQIAREMLYVFSLL